MKELIEAYLKHTGEMSQGDRIFGCEIIVSPGNDVIVEYGLTRLGHNDEYCDVDLVGLLGFMWGKMNEAEGEEG